MKKFLLLSLFLAFGLVLTGASCTQTPETTLTLTQDTFTTADKITVTYNIVEPLGVNAWLGIVPSETVHGNEAAADAVDVDYEYLDNSTSGSLTFPAPTSEGKYDFRVYSDDSADAKELGYTSFTVANE